MKTPSFYYLSRGRLYFTGDRSQGTTEGWRNFLLEIRGKSVAENADFLRASEKFGDRRLWYYSTSLMGLFEYTGNKIIESGLVADFGDSLPYLGEEGDRVLRVQFQQMLDAAQLSFRPNALSSPVEAYLNEGGERMRRHLEKSLPDKKGVMARVATLWS